MDWNRLEMGWNGFLGACENLDQYSDPNSGCHPLFLLAKPRAKSILLPSHLHFDLNFSCQNGDFLFWYVLVKWWFLCHGDVIIPIIPIIRQESGPSATHHLISAPAQSWQSWWTTWVSPSSGGPVILTSTWDRYRIGDGWRWRLDGIGIHWSTTCSIL